MPCGISSLSELVDAGLTIDRLGPDSLMLAFQIARRQLSLMASMRCLPVSEFACTLLVSVLGRDRALFGQIGDGAIVIGSNERLRPVFWPQSGEYANTTNFLTGLEFESRIETVELHESVSEIAIFTDGLQNLALRFAERMVHEPFFSPMFANLSSSEDPRKLDEPLRSFLGSKPVNDRTDDDKTLLLATRCKI